MKLFNGALQSSNGALQLFHPLNNLTIGPPNNLTTGTIISRTGLHTEGAIPGRPGFHSFQQVPKQNHNLETTKCFLALSNIW